ncbi:MAG: lipopolysaccharide kinase InaA family protein [Candidatus Binatia bacterium]
MGSGTEYRFYREGDWKLLVWRQTWTQGLWAEVLRHLRGQVPAHHPQTTTLCYPPDGRGQEFYLKIYHQSDLLGTIKDLFRRSKAFRALKQSEALLREGFHTPRAVAAGEKRTLRFIRKAFLLTLSVEGTSLPLFLQENCCDASDSRPLRRKREYLRQLAFEIRRLHQFGFVHGDLVPYNILVQMQGDGVNFVYVDNDRTRRYPRWFPHALWRRNLVQLNRFFLPGISKRDRVRFFRFYLGCRRCGKKERRLLRWLDEKTQNRVRARNE